jgi:uncharacterized protein (DUF111 family)
MKRPVRKHGGPEMADRKDRVCELECNIDDMTSEELAFAAEQLMKAGARDVQIMPIVMKKGRPAHLLTVMCSDEEEEKERFARLMFRYTTTIGIREIISERYVLDRTAGTADTPYGPVRYKHVTGYGADRVKAEFDDLAKIAEAQDISIAEARALVMPFISEEIRKMR